MWWNLLKITNGFSVQKLQYIMSPFITFPAPLEQCQNFNLNKGLNGFHMFNIYHTCTSQISLHILLIWILLLLSNAMYPVQLLLQAGVISENSCVQNIIFVKFLSVISTKGITIIEETNPKTQLFACIKIPAQPEWVFCTGRTLISCYGFHTLIMSSKVG